MKDTIFSILICAILFFTCCDVKETVRTEEEQFILELAYDDNYLYPQGFYSEQNSQGFSYYENTVSILPIDEREHVWIELSTDIKSQAREWSDKSNDNSSVNRVVISESENEKYFEFVRQNIGFDNDIMRSRVHKKSYFIPMVNHFFEPDTIGVYKGELIKSKVEELVEYLWYNGNLDINYSKVIESSLKDTSDYFEHYIKSLKLIGGDFGINDQILVYDNFITVNKLNGVITVKSKEVMDITGF